MAKGKGKGVKHCDQLFDVLSWWNFQLLVENPGETGFSLGEEPKTINATLEYTTRARLLPWYPFNLKGLLLCATLQSERFCGSDRAQEILGNTKINSIPSILCTLLCNLDLFFYCEEMRFHSSWVTPEKILLPWQAKWNFKVNSPHVSTTVLQHAAAEGIRGWLQARIMSLIESISLLLYWLADRLPVWRVASETFVSPRLGYYTTERSFKTGYIITLLESSQ